MAAVPRWSSATYEPDDVIRVPGWGWATTKAVGIVAMLPFVVGLPVLVWTTSLQADSRTALVAAVAVLAIPSSALSTISTGLRGADEHLARRWTVIRPSVRPAVLVAALNAVVAVLALVLGDGTVSTTVAVFTAVLAAAACGTALGSAVVRRHLQVRPGARPVPWRGYVGEASRWAGKRDRRRTDPRGTDAAG